MGLPGLISIASTGAKILVRGARVPHHKILEALNKPSTGGRGIVEIYSAEVVPIKTRIINLLGRKVHARIIHTLLGYEVQASNKRIHCPDMVTARYLKLFSEIGCRSIRLPYDPTVTERLLPELEQSMTSIERGTRELFPNDHELQVYVMRRICSLLRSRLLRQELR